MNINDLKPRLLIAALAAGVGLGVALFGEKATWVAELDSACVHAASIHETDQPRVHDIDLDSQVITIRTLASGSAKERGFQLIQVTDDPDRIFEHSPPSALDYAVMLESLHNRGFKDVILTTRMSWDQHPGLEAAGLSSRLALFEHSVIPLPVTRAATAQPLPAPLQRALIPFSQVSGNHRLIPLVNKVPLPTHSDGGEHTLAGFCQIENAPASEGNIPLLAHWQHQGLIPSVDLLAIMSTHDISPAELMIQCGKHIRLGKDGPVIPIDDYGQSPILDPANPTPPTTAPSPPPLDADQLITPGTPNSKKKISSPAHNKPQSTIALIYAVGERSSATNTLSADRLQKLLALSASYPVPENLTRIPRLPLWASIIMIIDIALLSCWLGDLTRINRHLAYLLTAALLFPLLLTLLYFSQHWLGLSAPLATLITAWIIPVPKPKSQWKLRWKPKWKLRWKPQRKPWWKSRRKPQWQSRRKPQWKLPQKPKRKLRW